MQPYVVELTAKAETEYERLQDEAAENGRSGKRKKVLLATVEEALYKTIPANPTDLALALAGRLSYIYKLSLDSVCIYYAVDTEKHLVYILHIGSPRNCVDRSWLKDAMMSGKMANILQRLGIDNPSMLDETSSLWMH